MSKAAVRKHTSIAILRETSGIGSRTEYLRSKNNSTTRSCFLEAAHKGGVRPLESAGSGSTSFRAKRVFTTPHVRSQRPTKVAFGHWNPPGQDRHPFVAKVSLLPPHVRPQPPTKVVSGHWNLPG